MRFLFRVDASLSIGAGHVMRCLTLADALGAKGVDCQFICREHAGNLIDLIQSKGYKTHRLPRYSETDKDLDHSHWLESTQEQDAERSEPIAAIFNPDWLVVDSYALDYRWEKKLASYCGQIMVIDDLVDRSHFCQLLLDQTFGRSPNSYLPRVPRNCKLLCGTHYALLRPEFSELREYSLKKREQPQLKRLIVSLGGIDQGNVTAKVLTALTCSTLPNDCEITVVLGATAPWLPEIRQQAITMPWKTTVHVGANNMAQLMANSDLAIGAAGASSWERCCLGLPTIMLVLAANQFGVANAIEAAGAAYLIRETENLNDDIPALLGQITKSLQDLSRVSIAASGIVDGFGVDEVISNLGV